MISMSTTNSAEDWEVVDDDGFIFKRRKKSELNLGEPETVEENKRSVEAQQRFSEALARRKKMGLLEAQKIKYMAEIEDWRRLLNIQEFEIRPKDPVLPESHEPQEHVSKEVVDDSTNVLELQMQVETCEEGIERLKKLLNRGKHMCNMLEKTIKNENSSQQFKGLIDEVSLLQNSPRFLIGGLTSSQPASPGVRGLPVSTDVGRLLAQSPA